MSNQLYCAILFALPITAMAVLIILNNKTDKLVAGIQLVFSGLLLVISTSLFLTHHGFTVIQVANWPAPFGISIVFDTLRTFMLMIFSLCIFCINLFDLQQKTHKLYFYLGFWLIILGIIGSLTTYDIFNLYVWAEVILVSAFILLSVDNSNTDTHTVYNYAIFNIFATLLILVGIAMIYGVTGQLNYAAIAQFAQNQPPAILLPSMILLLLGLCIKGGIFPYYFWLPKTYPDSNSSSMLLLSSLVTKVIMIVILQLVWLWKPLTQNIVEQIFIFLACCTMTLGVLAAANNKKIKHILSLHIISQLGYIVLAVFIHSPLAIVAAVYFLIHNILVKTGLLMTASVVESHYQTNKLDNLGQLIKQCPQLAILFFILALSLAGIPPLSGFWAKLFVFKAAIDEHHIIAVYFALFVSLFTLYSMIKIWRFAYCEANTYHTNQSFKLSLPYYLGILPLLGCSLVIGLYPDLILPSLQNIATQLSQPTLAINLVLGGQ